MTITRTVKMAVNCKKYEVNAPSLSEGESITLDLELKEADLGKFLFKFAPNMFQLGGYKVAYSNLNGKPNYAFYKNRDVYIVVNPQQFISELINGYESLRISAHVLNLLDIENTYWAADSDESDEPVDEFDIDEDKLADIPKQEVLHEQADQMDDSMEEIDERNMYMRENGQWVDPVLLMNRRDLQ